MILEIKTPTEIKLDSLEDLQGYKKFMDDNNLKINVSALARRYKIDRRTITKYFNGFEKKETKNKTSKLDKYYDLIKTLLSSSTVNVNVKIYKKDKIKLYNQSKLVSRFKKCFIF